MKPFNPRLIDTAVGLAGAVVLGCAVLTATMEECQAEDTTVVLMESVERGDLASVQRSLSGGASVEFRFHDGRTPLMVAASRGHIEIVEWLLNHGADVNARDSYGTTPLMHASYDGHVDVADLLVRSGAEVSARNSQEDSALFWAVRNGNIALVQLLLDRGANVDDRNLSGHTPLISAAQGGDEEVARLLISFGAAVDARARAGTTALIFSSRSDKYVELSRLLIMRGSDPNAKAAGTGETPLLLASRNGAYKTVALLLGHGADVNTPDALGYTPLMRAEEEGHPDVANLLRARGGETRLFKRPAYYFLLFLEQLSKLPL